MIDLLYMALGIICGVGVMIWSGWHTKQWVERETRRRYSMDSRKIVRRLKDYERDNLK